MWLWNLLKELWAAHTAAKAAQAATDLPAGQVAIDQINADGKTIEAQLAAALPKPTPPTPAK